MFRYQAADDILELLYRHPHREFTVTELRTITGHGGKSVHNAIQILESIELISVEKRGRYTLIAIDQERIHKPDDPLLEIPQREFRQPVNVFLDRVTNRQDDNLVGIILFGSVARGEADRTSDIDLQVIVEGDLVKSRRELQTVRQAFQNETFDGNRYEIQLLVESVASAQNYGEKLQEIFSEGIILYSTPELDAVKEVVFCGE